jgi:lipid II:glycine glycyltransferase (peptidoglycan interpeptide bridge formation enzyme)
MSYELATIISRKEWDSFFLDHGQYAFFQSWLWGQLQERLGFQVWRYGIYEGKTLRGIALVVKVVARRGSFLQIRHGPIFDTQGKEQWKWFLTEIKALAKSQNVWFIRLNPLIENSIDNRTFYYSLGLKPAAIHAMDAEYTWVLPLEKSQEELLSGMRKTTRYEIRRAINAGVTIEKTTDPAQLKLFFCLYDETMKRQDFVPNRGIAEEFDVFAKEGKALLLLGSYQGKISAAAIVLFDSNQAIYHYGASIPSDVGVSYLVQWEAICEAKKRGILQYNFWGIAPQDNPRHPWRGITLFKTGFGGSVHEYIHAHDLPISPQYIIPRFIETWRRWRKGY